MESLRPKSRGTSYRRPGDLLLPLRLPYVDLLVPFLCRHMRFVGDVRWQGYLGGAVAMQLRVGNPVFARALFPVYAEAIAWISAWCRHPLLRRKEGVYP